MTWPGAHAQTKVGGWPRKGLLGQIALEHYPTEQARGFRAVKTAAGMGYAKAPSLDAFGGGWIQLTNSLTNVGGIDANGVRRWNWSVGSSCGGYQIFAMDLYVPYTEMLIVFNRIAGTAQCTDFQTNSRISYESGYYTTPTYQEAFTPFGMCNWGDFVWAKNTGGQANDISGLQNNWVVRLKNSAPGEQVRWRLACHGSSGTTDHTYYVR